MIKNVKVTHHSAWQGKLYTNQNIPIRGHKGASTGFGFGFGSNIIY